MNVQIALALLKEFSEKTSQDALSESVGVGDSTISRWLSGTSKPQGENKGKLITWAERMSSTPPAPPSSPNPLTGPRLHSNRHFKDLYERATTEQKKWIAQLMLDAIVANANDLREILELDPPSPAPTPTAHADDQATRDKLAKHATDAPPTDRSGSDQKGGLGG